MGREGFRAEVAEIIELSPASGEVRSQRTVELLATTYGVRLRTWPDEG